MALIQFTTEGLYCPQGKFYIDPWKPVDRAVITHAHSDHARPGSKNYLCHPLTKPILQLRLGDNAYQTAEWGEVVHMNGVKVSLHPAGHIIGSSQVRVEYNGETWVISGDYKTDNDGISGAFEPVKCQHFVTESTFGLPIYKWQPQQLIFEDIKNWVKENHEAGRTSVLIAYSLGKAQRIMKPLAETGLPIFLHGAVHNVHETFIKMGIDLPAAHRVTPTTPKAEMQGNIVVAPSGAEGSSWIKKFTPYRVGVCSGWMQVRGNKRRRNADAGFALSDHAGWEGLLQAVEATEAEHVFTTHGFQAAFSRYLNEHNIASSEIKTEFGSDEDSSIVNEENPDNP